MSLEAYLVSLSGFLPPQTRLPHPGGKGQGPNLPPTSRDPHPPSLDKLFRECQCDPRSGVVVGSRTGPGLA